MTTSIEIAQPEDAAEILQLQKLAFHQEAVLHNDFNIPPLQQDLQSVRNEFLTNTFYKLCTGGQILASARVRILDSGMLWIGRVIVHPDVQRTGLGSRLMDRIEQDHRGVIGYELFTAEKSIHNIRFYERLGYRLVRRYRDPQHKDIMLVKMEKRNPGS